MVEVTKYTKGWKGYLGAAILLAAGFYLLYNSVIDRGIELIGLGLALLGIRHRLDYCKKK